MATGYERAVINWVVARGEPMGSFGTAGKNIADEARASLDLHGIDYENSSLGDLAGKSWTEDTYDEGATHPGVWANVAYVRLDQVVTECWFVSGEYLMLSAVIAEVLAAADQGEDIWRSMVTDEDKQEAAVRFELWKQYIARNPR